jgi:hypothetical protein
MALLSIQKLKLLALIGATAALVACGGGGSSAPAQAINGNLTGNVSAANIAALLGTTLTFPNGVSEFGTTTATTVAFGGTAAAPTATITNGGNTSTADVTYGSCIFTIKSASSNGSLARYLIVGNVITVNPCTLTFETNGKTASPNPQTVTMTSQFGTNSKVFIFGSFTLTADGRVLLSNGDSLGGLVLTPVTGATGAGS